jgi:hypothetical protein
MAFWPPFQAELRRWPTWPTPWPFCGRGFLFEPRISLMRFVFFGWRRAWRM